MIFQTLLGEEHHVRLAVTKILSYRHTDRHNDIIIYGFKFSFYLVLFTAIRKYNLFFSFLCTYLYKKVTGCLLITLEIGVLLNNLILVIKQLHFQKCIML